jgi:hypothetical protein
MFIRSIPADAFGDGDILHLAIDPTNPLRLVASTQASQVIKSPDGGATWSPYLR